MHHYNHFLYYESCHSFMYKLTYQKIPGAQTFTKEEQVVILALGKEGEKPREIAEHVGRLRASAHRVLRWGRVRGVVKSGGPPAKISVMMLRIMVRRARLGKLAARKLRDMYWPKVTVRRIQHLLSEAPDLQYVRMLRVSPLSRKH